jgi:hypothetical protein
MRIVNVVVIRVGVGRIWVRQVLVVRERHGRVRVGGVRVILVLLVHLVRVRSVLPVDAGVLPYPLGELPAGLALVVEQAGDRAGRHVHPGTAGPAAQRLRRADHGDVPRSPPGE